MTYFHYYATTSRNLDRVLQYGVFPLSQAIAWVWCNKNHSPDPLRDSARLARWASSLVYASLTTGFMGAESEMIDISARKAVAAELGVDPQKLSFSDFKYSDNAIIHTAHRDIMRLQKWRYGTDFMFLIPTAIDHIYEGFSGKQLPSTKNMQRASKEKAREFTAAEILLNGHTAANYGVLAGKALYWAGETYFIDKSGFYEVNKVIETLQSTGKDMAVNDLLGIYQRTRGNDRKLSLIDTKQEYEALRPLLQKMVDAYNQHDGKFGIQEVIYLVGLNKVNIHAPDNKNISQEAIERSSQEIDRVIKLGLDGIIKEKKREREKQGVSETSALHVKSLTDRLTDTTIGAARSFKDTAVSFVDMIRGQKSRRPEEYITVRDPGEVINLNISHNVHR